MSLGLSQQDVAAAIGVTKSAISNWENGRGAPSLALFAGLVDALNMQDSEVRSILRQVKKSPIG